MIDVEMRDIPGYEGLYAATSDGRIWSHKKQRFMTATGSEGCYRIVCLSKDGKAKSLFVHRLIALTYIPNPDNLPQVNHKDKVKDHNWADNLEWCTAKYNLSFSSVGSKEWKPVYCVELNKTFRSIRAAARELNICQPNISTCLSTGGTYPVGGYHWKYAKDIV